MIKSSVTISLVPELAGGPWVYWDPLETSIPEVKKLGFDGIELFIASATAIKSDHLHKLLQNYALELTAVATGAGKVLHGLTLTSPDKNIRALAQGYIKDIIRLAGDLGAPAIIGSMQGSVPTEGDRSQSLLWLADSLEDLAGLASSFDQPLLFEPLNRYETNIFNRLADAASYIEKLNAPNILLLADLFHMNIEETSIPQTLKSVRKSLGYIHFADSNRKAVGMGHIAIDEIAKVLQEIGFSGYLAAEVYPLPDTENAARQTIRTFSKYFRS